MSWYDGLVRRWRRRATLASPAPAPAVVRPPAAPAGTAPPQPQAVAAGARRPLVAASGRIEGFEFCIGAPTQRRVQRRGDTVAAAAYTHALLAAMRGSVQGGRFALAELPAAWLDRPGLEREMGPGLWLAVQYEDDAQAMIRHTPDVPSAASAWRGAGARLGWARLGGPPAVPDFWLLRPDGSDLEPLLAQFAACRARAPHAPLVVLDLADVDALERCLGAGAQVAALADGPRAELRGARDLPPQVARLAGLLNRLVRDADTAAVTADIKGDVALAVGLLRLLRAARFGGGRAIESVDQAVLLLGRDELYRWISLLLVQACGARPVAAALQEMALARARLLELLAAERGTDPPGALFTLGLASMLPVLLRLPVEQALASLALPDVARQAIAEGRGPWAHYLAAARATEQIAAEPDDALAVPFGGAARLRALQDEAWTWAAGQAAVPSR